MLKIRSKGRLHIEYLLSDSEEKTMQLRRSRNGNAPLGARGTTR